MKENFKSSLDGCEKKDLIYGFFLGYSADDMRNLPNPTDSGIEIVMCGVVIKINLVNLLGGYEITENGLKTAWLMWVKDPITGQETFQKLS